VTAEKKDQIAVDANHRFVGFDADRNVIDSSDVVLIACCSKFHARYAKAALDAGRHVFVEKPHAIDPHGIRELKAAIETAKKNNLCLASGLQSRHHPGIQETIKRIHGGAIGDIVAIEENFLRAPYRTFARQPGQTEIQYQFYNWYHFDWLSGDDVTQSLVHNVDRATQLMREQTPVKAHGLGGRASSFEEIYGNVFDHHAVVYEYGNGVRMYAFCRTEVGCYDESSSMVLGTKGRANLTRHIIQGETTWHYKGATESPYDIEHKKLFEAIRAKKTLPDWGYMARSTQVAIMGQLACYSGKEILWDDFCKSDFTFEPNSADFSTTPPVRPDGKGIYPCAVPGTKKLI
jgi:predicted dehydrogenase